MERKGGRVKYLNLSALFLTCLFLSACGDYKFQNDSSLTNAIAPLSEVEEDPSLLDQFPCSDGQDFNTQCKSEKKVEICHVPPGNPDAKHTLCIGESAISAHLSHHVAADGEQDYLGPCQDQQQQDQQQAGDDTRKL
jgi:hypothetical protein